MEHKRRSSRSGSLVNTPDHQAMQQVDVPVGKLFSFDDSSGETSNYLEANDSSATNSSCSFDAPPIDMPPMVPPRITNPLPRNHRTATSEHLIIIDTDTVTPIPAQRMKASKAQLSMTTTTSAAITAKPPILGFENSFVSNSLNVQKNNNGVNKVRPQPHIDPPPKHINHKLNMNKNETITSEVRRISSKMFLKIF